MKNTVTEQEVLEVIASQECVKLGNKSTVCLTTLKNGFEIITSSGCVDADNYNHDIGSEIAKKRAIDKVWELEGYALQKKLADEK